MIRYKDEAQEGRAHLLRNYNDLLVFVEDSTCQNMYVRVLSRILSGMGKISHVFPLNGRRNVVESAIRDDRKDTKRVYLIDGDLDPLTGRTIPACQWLHRIDAYSVENLLLVESALVGVGEECLVDNDAREIRGQLQFSNNRRATIRILLPLFVNYAVVARLDLPIETVSYSVMRLCRFTPDTIQLDFASVLARSRGVRTQIVDAVGWKTYRREARLVRELLNTVGDKSRVISGKSYLLPLAHGYLRTTMRLRDSFDGFRVRLAARYEPDTAPSLREFLQGALRANFALQGRA